MRLDELLEQKIILKHKYLNKIDPIKIKEKIYGIFPRNPYSNFPPMIKRNYYILNYKKFLSLECKLIDELVGRVSDSTINKKYNTKNELRYIDYLEKYYSKKKLNQKEMINTNDRHLDRIDNEINELVCKIKELACNDKRNYFKEIDHTERNFLLLSYKLRLIALTRELELTAIKERKFLDLLLPIDESSKELENCLEHFSKQGMSNADILIRLSTESTWLFIKRVSNFLRMIDYEDLFSYFLNRGRELP